MGYSSKLLRLQIKKNLTVRNHFPSDERMLYLQAIVKLNLGEQEAAINLLTQVANCDSPYPLAYLRLGDVLLKSGNRISAEDAYKNCLAKSPQNIHAMLGLAQISIQERNWETAILWLEKAIEQDDEASTPYALLVQVRKETGNDSKAQEALKQSYLGKEYIEPKDPWYDEMFVAHCFDAYQLQVIAEMATEAGNTDLANATIARAESIAPNDSNILVQVGSRALANNQIQTAKLKLSQAIRADSKNERAFIELARAHVAEKNIDKAISILRDGIEFNPQSADLHNFAGQLHLSQRDESQARIRFEKAISLNPMGLPQIKNLGLLLLSKDQSRGESLLGQYLSYQPDDLEIAGHFGRRLLEKNRTDEALSILERSFQSSRNPNDNFRKTYAAARHRKASELTRTGNLASAVVEFERSISAWPNNPEALANLGMLQAQLGEHDQAEFALSKFTSIQPQNPVAWLNLGKARLLANNRPAANAAWEHGLKLTNGNQHTLVRNELRDLLRQFSQ